MNRKFIVTGFIIKELMLIKRIDAIELAKRIGKTRTAIYLIQKREQIKDSHAAQIFDALGYTLKEVEEMDNDGLFSSKNNSVQSSKNIVIERLEELLKNTEKSLQEINKKQRERILALEEILKNKDIQINTLIGFLGGVK